MFLSIFDIFKIGIGPSSSHTMGPMNAALRFMGDLRDGNFMGVRPDDVQRVSCSLHGSLAFTGKGHATDRAVILGLLGFAPDRLDPDEAEAQEACVREEKAIEPDGFPRLRFNPDDDILFDYGPPLTRPRKRHETLCLWRRQSAIGQRHLLFYWWRLHCHRQ